jgi:cytochrome c oxidase assembly protein subunit 15
MKGGVLYEHGHRLVAATVGVMTLLLAGLMLWRRRDAWLGGAALVLVAIQAELGRITVLYNLPSAVSIAHLGTAMIFFSLIIAIAYRAGEPAPAATTAAARPWAFLGAGAVYLQILLGAAVRHLEAGMQCLDLPFCHGALWPEGSLAQVHMAHRIFACLATAAALAAAWKVGRAAPAGSSGRRMAWAVPFLLAAQVTLGVLSVESYLGLYQVTAHLAGGALLLGSMVWLVLSTAPAPAAALATATARAVS